MARIIRAISNVLRYEIGFKVPAQTLWTNDYLVENMGNQFISVAVTPDGCVV